MTRLAAILLTGALICAPVSLFAQTNSSSSEAAPQLPTATPRNLSGLPYRILDQDRLLRGSQLGQQILAGIRAAEARLEAENQTLFDQLAAEERALTDARASLSTEEFRARADAFDARVEEIRTERAQISQQLARWSEGEAQRFYDAALPILVDMMNDEGVLALLRPETVILGSDALDLTSEAIARLDAAGVDTGEPAPFPPLTETAPDQAPAPQSTP